MAMSNQEAELWAASCSGDSPAVQRGCGYQRMHLDGKDGYTRRAVGQRKVHKQQVCHLLAVSPSRWKGGTGRHRNLRLCGNPADVRPTEPDVTSYQADRAGEACIMSVVILINCPDTQQNVMFLAYQADRAGDACIMSVVILSPSWNTSELRMATMLHISGPVMTAKENWAEGRTNKGGWVRAAETAKGSCCDAVVLPPLRMAALCVQTVWKRCHRGRLPKEQVGRQAGPAKHCTLFPCPPKHSTLRSRALCGAKNRWYRDSALAA